MEAKQREILKLLSLRLLFIQQSKKKNKISLIPLRVEKNHISKSVN